MRADCYTQRRSVPGASWIDTPTFGILRGTVTGDGSSLDGITMTLSNGVTGTSNTDGTGFYAFLQLNPGSNYTATTSAAGFFDQSKNFNITAGTVTTLDFALSSTTPTPTPTPTATPSPTPVTGIPHWNDYGGLNSYGLVGEAADS